MEKKSDPASSFNRDNLNVTEKEGLRADIAFVSALNESKIALLGELLDLAEALIAVDKPHDYIANCLVLFMEARRDQQNVRRNVADLTGHVRVGHRDNNRQRNFRSLGQFA